MAKFGKKSNTSQDIPTAALPDIIFMLLFFFMVTTVLRETDILVKQKLPKAIQLTKRPVLSITDQAAESFDVTIRK